jgi:hypothetical protein
VDDELLDVLSDVVGGSVSLVLESSSSGGSVSPGEVVTFVAESSPQAAIDNANTSPRNDAR